MAIDLLSLLLLIPALGVIQANGNQMELEKNAGVDLPAVPRHALIAPMHDFQPPASKDIESAFEKAHEASEAVYLGNGEWGKPRNWDALGEYKPYIRETSYRVVAYLSAWKVLRTPIYRQRAVEGLEYLLKEMTPRGDFRWYYRSYGGVTNNSDGLFDSGCCGVAFTTAWELLRDPQYLDAAKRVADYQMSCPISPNTNYNQFATWHLSSLYRITGEKRYLDEAIRKARDGGFPEQMPYGGWPGHNSWIWYHGIIVRGMAELYSVLPTGHPFRPELRKHLVAALNRVVNDQLPSGELTGGPATDFRTGPDPHTLQALLVARRSFGDSLDPVIHGLARCIARDEPASEESQETKQAWRKYQSDLASARKAATGQVVWRADFSTFRQDEDWGEMAGDAFNCWYPVNDFTPQYIHWTRVVSERTGRPCQEVRATGDGEQRRLFGGVGWSIPNRALKPGRKYRLIGWVKAVEGPGCEGKIPLVLGSIYAGDQRPNWNPMNECQMDREQPEIGGFRKVECAFIASPGVNYVY